MPSMVFDTQGTGFYKRAARQMMAQKEITFLGESRGGGGLGDEIMLLSGIDDLGTMYPHGYDDGPARTYTMPTTDRGTLYDFSTGPVSTGMSGAKLGASVQVNQGAWPRQTRNPRWDYTGLGAGWPQQQSRYLRPTLRFTGPSRGPSRLRMAVEAAKREFQAHHDFPEIMSSMDAVRQTASELAGSALRGNPRLGAVNLIALLELAAVRYPDSAFARGGARHVYEAAGGDSLTYLRTVLRSYGTDQPEQSISGLRGASIRRGRYAYTGLNGLGDAQSDARTAMAIAQTTRDTGRAACSLITNTRDKARCEAGVEAAFSAARAAIVAGYGTDGTYAPSGSSTPPSAATAEQVAEKLRMQAEETGVPTPPQVSQGISTNTLVIGGIVVAALAGAAYIMTRPRQPSF